MAKKIEIFENTLLKLLVRRGTDADRRNVTLSEGELGYTIDTKKLYIGDGQTVGGVPAGGVSFLGSYPLPHNQVPTTFKGDLIFGGSSNTLYSYIGPNWKESSSWLPIGGIYTGEDSTISINSTTNQIKVGQLSAGNISSSAIGSSLAIDVAGKITLSNTIRVDEISTKTYDRVTIPTKFNYRIGNGFSSTYTLPGATETGFLYTNANGQLSWSLPPEGSTLFVTGSAIVPVGTIVPFPTPNNIPHGWLLCDGQEVYKSTYPELAKVFNVSTDKFFVPDLRNKTIYGTSNPQGATLYPIVSSTPGLSLTPVEAQGMLYIIKARPDNVVDIDMEVTYPIIATLNNTEMQSNEVFSPLDGSVKIELDTSGPLGFRNKVINGNFDFWQRRSQTLNVPVSSIPTYTTNGTRTIMTADRWRTYASAGSNAKGTFSVTREHNNRVNFPLGDEDDEENLQLNDNFFLRLSYKDGVGTYNDNTNLYDSLCSASGAFCIQNIENASEILGKTVTLSFWARAKEETYIFSETQIHSSDAGMRTPATVSELMLLTPDWQFFTHTYTMPTFAQVSAVAYDPDEISTVNGKYLARPNYTPLGSRGLLPPLSSWLYQVDIKTHWSRGTAITHGHSISATANGFNYFYPGSGAPVNYPIGNFMTMPVLSTLCTNVLSSADGGYYDIAQIQLEVGKGPTHFEHRPQQLELALCQRYFEKNYDVNIPPGTSGLLPAPTLYGSLNTRNFLQAYPLFNGTNYTLSFQSSYKVPKVRVPLVTMYSPRTGIPGCFTYDFATTDFYDLNFIANNNGLVAVSDTNGFGTGGYTNYKRQLNPTGAEVVLAMRNCFTAYAADAEIY